MRLREEQGERIYLPTPLRLREARQRGQVARSADLASIVTVLGGLAALALLGQRMLNALTRMTAGMLSGAGDDRSGLGTDLFVYLGPVLVMLAGLWLIVVAMAVFGNVIQVGVGLTGQPLHPNAERISPGAGLRRLASARTVVRGAMAVLKIAAVGCAAVMTIRGAMPRLAAAAQFGPAQLCAVAGDIVWAFAVRAGVALLGLAILDYLYQRWQYRQDLKMTRPEFMEDVKRMEVDPLTRKRRREIGRAARSSQQASDSGAAGPQEV